MIAGIGTDIVDIDYFSITFLNGFQEEQLYPALNRILTQDELNYCWKKKYYAQHMAVRFAAKEAFIKSVTDCSLSNGMRNIEIMRKEDGQPYIRLHNQLKTNYCLFEFKVSMSHCKHYATATVIAQMASLGV